MIDRDPRPSAQGVRRAGWAGAGFVLAALLVHLWVSGRTLLDLEVYRLGGRTWLAGYDLYAPGFPRPFDGPSLPFTYPPAAALAFVPLAVVPLGAAAVLMTSAGLVAAGVTLRVTLRQVGRDGTLPTVVLMVLVACALLEPLRSTLGFGQVNLCLMALVVVDCFEVPARYRGLLTGLAASIKLVPLGFVLFFLATGDRRAVVRLVGGFAVVTSVALALAPTDSWQYWTSVLLDAGRIGTPGWITNQSLTGVLSRTDLPPNGVTVVLMTALGLLAAGAFVGARGLLRSGRRVAALVVVAAWCLLASPVSWSHHWVWVLPALVALADVRWADFRRSRLAVGAAVVVVFSLVPPFWSEGWGPLVDDAYAWSAVLLVLATAVASFRTRGAAVSS